MRTDDIMDGNVVVHAQVPPLFLLLEGYRKKRMRFVFKELSINTQKQRMAQEAIQSSNCMVGQLEKDLV